MANTYPIVNLDKVSSSYVGNIENVQSASALNNGTLVNLGSLIAGESQIYTVGVPATGTLTTAEVLLVASDEVIYQRYNVDGTIANKGDFRNAAAAPAKAYHLAVGDTFSLTDNGFDGTPAVDSYLIPQNGSTKGLVAANLAGATRFAAIITAIGLTSLDYEGNSATRFRVVSV